ncbi:MAG: DUF72 domain-containing protein [Deltaproteobacteria bacterium]|nr:MAG: DUF72 domain-containing protein [Deltaproteobacteria bacterium]
MHEIFSQIDEFRFRGLHPRVRIGTASDRYAGWIGQVYSEHRYADRITSRKKTVGRRAFVEKVLPVECVSEYFQHFAVLELDFTFYRPLLDETEQPTPSFHLLRKYRACMNGPDRIILKVPQMIFARKLRRGGTYVPNDQYLNPEGFIRRFHTPAVEVLGTCLGGFIFEQEYQRKQDRVSPERLARELDRFFTRIPEDRRYHIELRTEAYLSAPVFRVFEKHGLGQVLSNWTWLPSLSRQHGLSGGRFFNTGGECVIRLMTPSGMRYEDAYARAYPFGALVDGMLDEEQVRKTAEFLYASVEKGIRINVIVNNRYGGNAPITAQHIARQFVRRMSRSAAEE